MKKIEKIKKTERIIIEFLQSQYDESRNDAKKTESNLNQLLWLSANITAGEVRSIELEKVDAWIKLKTGFANPLASSSLLGKETEYLQMVGIKINSKDISNYLLENGVYTISKKYDLEMRENATFFLNATHNGTYSILLRACKILNENIGCGKFIKLNYAGEASINLHMLNNSGR